MLEPYIPRKFCREFAEFGCNQLALIMATVLGLKPVTDVWVPTARFDEFKKICQGYNLAVEPAGVFVEPGEGVLEETYRKDPFLRTSTTVGVAIGYSQDALKGGTGEVHAFISLDASLFEDANRFGWYPWVVDGILIGVPLIDSARFGRVLGYPECCVEFYTRNHRPDIPIYHNRLKNTKGKYSYYCNNVLNHFSYSYVHHTSCSLDCKETIRQARKIEKAIYDEEPEYVEQIRKALRLPLIVYGEKNSYVFQGKVQNNTLFYKEVMFTGDSTDDQYGQLFSGGNKAIVHHEQIEIFRNSSLVSSIKKEDPKFGFLLQFM